MADVISPDASDPQKRAVPASRVPGTEPVRAGQPAIAEPVTETAPDVPYSDLMSLLFFAYRDFVRDADAILASYGFGRAHHRVLHFVSRHPGLRVTELLDILKITKQSLGRVLRELIDTGFVAQIEGPVDRRQRLLYTTARGHRLALELAGLQGNRIGAALEACGDGAHEQARAFLSAMVAPEEQDSVARLVGPMAPAHGRSDA